MNKHAPIFENKPLDRNGDYLSEAGAYALAGRIRAFWQARGFAVRVWVAKLVSSASATSGDREIFVVKSDLVNGRPQ